MSDPGTLSRWGKPVAILALVVFFISAAFPVTAGLFKHTEGFPKWWGRLDVGIAFLLVLLAFAVIELARGHVYKDAQDTTYKFYRVLIHGILLMLLVFFLFGDRIIWINCLTGFAWRAWLLLYSLPAWVTALRSSARLPEVLPSAHSGHETL